MASVKQKDVINRIPLKKIRFFGKLHIFQNVKLLVEIGGNYE